MHFLRNSFRASALYHEGAQEPLIGFLKRRWAFWLALLSCFAFLIGNMVGQHGWHSFWKSVWGRERNIVFTGTVSPVAGYPLPMYRENPSCEPIVDDDDLYYPVRYLGDYRFGGDGCGSHAAVDIKLPVGIDIIAVANGIIESVEYRNWGFGNTVVLRIPNAPHDSERTKLVTYYAGYAHLGDVLVKPGDIVTKGAVIAYSGNTGFSTTPHLQFQIDKSTADFHPYWPFTMDDVRQYGLHTLVDGVNAAVGMDNARRYTISPLLYTQKYADWSVGTTIVDSTESSSAVEPPRRLTWREQLQQKLQQRLARRRTRISNREVPVTKTSSSSSSSSSEPEVVVKPPKDPTPPRVPQLVTHHGNVTDITVFHDGEISFEKEKKIVLYARDSKGNFVQDVSFEGSFYLETQYGEAEFSPTILTAADFDERGRAFVTVKPLSRKTVIPLIRGAFQVEGKPLKVVGMK